MSYQVLARKWRPRTFADLVGQEHVVQALVNGLTRGQLHHAYLFTGTRGVGKTTLARILAKTLNCETGIGPTPCGVCATCREIDEGRYVDLIEVDAASRTKVDQTRELLDNVPFAPVRGRFKVYLIDEVHMFSASSFNALLKTLEEPPGHVKFVLATTDPQRLPATVLSRCLQFNLKRLLPEQIRGQFETVLRAEGIDFDEAALLLLAAAADGSMRDGLSLLDQAIAFGGGRVGEADVRLMLGTRDDDLALDLIGALAAGDGAALLAEIDRIAGITPDFGGLLTDLLTLLHRIALAQQVPATLRADDPARERLAALAAAIPPEDVQLFYQVLLLGQADLPLAPDPRAGLEMVLLRALAFRPDEDGGSDPAAHGPVPAPAGRPATSSAAASTQAALTGRARSGPTAVAGSPPAAAASVAEGPPVVAPAAARLVLPPETYLVVASADPAATPAAPALRPMTVLADAAAPTPAAAPTTVHPDDADRPAMALAGLRAIAATPTHPTPPVRRPHLVEVPGAPVSPALAPWTDCATPSAPVASPPSGVPLRDPADWRRFAESGAVSALAAELARHCALVGWEGWRLRLTLDPALAHLRGAAAEQRLAAALSAFCGGEVRLEISHAPALDSTPAALQARDAEARQAEAEAIMAADPLVEALARRFGARLVPGSVQAAA